MRKHGPLLERIIGASLNRGGLVLDPFRGCGPPTGPASGRYRHIVLRDRSGKGRQARGRLNPARRQTTRHGRGLLAFGPQFHQLQGMDRKFLAGPRPNGRRIAARGNPPDGDMHAPVVAQVRGGAARSRHRGTSNGSSTVSVRWPTYSFRSSAARTPYCCINWRSIFYATSRPTIRTRTPSSGRNPPTTSSIPSNHIVQLFMIQDTKLGEEHNLLRHRRHCAQHPQGAIFLHLYGLPRPAAEG